MVDTKSELFYNMCECIVNLRFGLPFGPRRKTNNVKIRPSAALQSSELKKIFSFFSRQFVCILSSQITPLKVSLIQSQRM